MLLALNGIAIGDADAARVRQGVGPAEADLGIRFCGLALREELRRARQAPRVRSFAIECRLARRGSRAVRDQFRPTVTSATVDRVERVQQRVHRADRADLVRRVELRPAGVAAVAGAGAEERVAPREFTSLPNCTRRVERRAPARCCSRCAAPGRCAASPARSGRCSCTAGCRVGSVAFGSGNRFSICWPIGLIRLAGILLPGKQPGPPVVDVARQPLRRQQRILDPDAAALAVERLREVAGPLERRRHRAQRQAARVVARQEVLRQEEEQLVAVAC